MLKAIIFDMDDTLIDWSQRSVDWVEYEHRHLARVFDYLSRKYDVTCSLEAFWETSRKLTHQAWTEVRPEMRAPNMSAVMARTLEQIGLPVGDVDIRACLEAYGWEPVSGVRAFADVLELMPVLRSRGIRFGLITNAYQPMWMRDRELEAYGLLPHFADCRLSSADVGYLKPHPAIFQAALDCLGIQADEAIFIGDSPEADIAGAQSVGMKAVLRVGTNAAPMISGLIIPDGAIHSLHELLPLLDRWYPSWRSSNGTGVPDDVTGINSVP